MTFKPHPTPPAPDQGAIAFFTARPTAVSQVRLIADPQAPAGVSLVDLDQACAVDGWDTLAELQDRLGPVVYPDLGAYKRSSAWRLAQVLEALGVDAAELLEADLDEDEDWSDDADDAPYDFDQMPPVALAQRGQWSEFDTDDAAAGEVDPEDHAAAWARYMLEHTPRGFDVIEVATGWEWGKAGEPVGADVPYGIGKAQARAGAWAAYLRRHAEILLDLLGLAGLWPVEQDGLWPVIPGDPILAARLAWVEGWTLLERGLAGEWAACTHLRASDNDDIEIPARPACIDRERPA